MQKMAQDCGDYQWVSYTVWNIHLGPLRQHRGRQLPASLKTWVRFSGPTWWKDITDSCKLSSNCPPACHSTHTQISVLFFKMTLKEIYVLYNYMCFILDGILVQQTRGIYTTILFYFYYFLFFSKQDLIMTGLKLLMSRDKIKYNWFSKLLLFVLSDIRDKNLKCEL